MREREGKWDRKAGQRERQAKIRDGEQDRVGGKKARAGQQDREMEDKNHTVLLSEK